MNERDRMLAAVRGEPSDALPWVPRMDLWAIGQETRGTMPERFRRMNIVQIADELGIGCHAVRADFTAIPWDQRDPRDFIFRPFGIENHPDFPFRVEINDLPVDFAYEYGKYRTVIHAPAGDVATFMEYDDSMARDGITQPEVRQRVIAAGGNLEAVAQVYEHFEVVPTPAGYWDFHERIGGRGLAIAQGVISASPVHAIPHQLMDMETFFYWWADDPDALRGLGARMAPFFERVLDVLCESQAEAVLWGANYDQDTTWPPFFAQEIVPYVARVGDRVREAGKIMLSHCDGEMDQLLPLMPGCRFDVAESVCTEPMTRRSLRDLRLGLGATTTIWGGLPAVAFMNGPMSDDAFERHLDRVFGELGSGKRLILGVSDNMPVDANIERVERVTKRVREFGPVMPSPDGQL
jgi:hypothetical protein